MGSGRTRIELCGQLVVVIEGERLDQLLAADRPVAVQDQVREQEPALTAAQRPLESLALDLDHELTTELDAGPSAPH